MQTGHLRNKKYWKYWGSKFHVLRSDERYYQRVCDATHFNKCQQLLFVSMYRSNPILQQNHCRDNRYPCHVSRFADMRGRRRSMTGDPFTAQRKGKKISISRNIRKDHSWCNRIFFYSSGISRRVEFCILFYRRLLRTWIIPYKSTWGFQHLTVFAKNFHCRFSTRS